MRHEDFEAIEPWLLVTDVGMLAYWGMTAASALGWIHVPAAWLYSDADNPLIVAWNWSFFPLDVAFAAAGLTAAWLHRRGHPGWRVLLPISLVLTWCAGVMAISFWAIRGDFDPLWWGLNLFLAAWPSAFLPRLWRGIVPPGP